MKYALIDTFWGWLARPILLWNLNDICTVVLEIIVIKTWFSTIKEMLKSRRRIDMLKIGIHRAKYYHSQWYYYIIPRRLTLKCNPPIYKWLWFVISYKKGE